MKRWLWLLMVMVGLALPVDAQTETFTPTPSETPSPTATPTPEPWSFITMVPEVEGTPGQMTRFDYIATAGDVQTGTLLAAILYSLWGMFLFMLILGLVLLRRK